MSETDSKQFDSPSTDVASVELVPSQNEVCTSANDVSAKATPHSRETVVETLRSLVQQGEVVERSVTDRLRAVFFRLHNQELEKARKAFVENGGLESEFVMNCPLEKEYKDLQAQLKTRRNDAQKAADAQKQHNLSEKENILATLQAAISNGTPTSYEDLQTLQQRWQALGEVPTTVATALWRNYNAALEAYYDLLGEEHAACVADFAQNLAHKTALCEQVEALQTLEDVVQAAAQLDNLREAYRQIGPVALGERKAIWSRFKAAVQVVNKRHQEHFLHIKENEAAKAARKETICQEIEAIELTQLTTPKAWEQQLRRVLELQAEWRTLSQGYHKSEQAANLHFRLLCNRFFAAKNEYYAAQREQMRQNVLAKTALCERAEALATTEDRTATQEIIKQLQTEWKTVGHCGRESQSLWERFSKACRPFFGRAAHKNSARDAEQADNLQKKQDLIARLETLATEGSQQLREAVKALQTEWNTIGHVPYAEKESIYEQYRQACDRIYDQLHEKAGQRRIERLVEDVKQQAEGKEAQRLQRIYEKKQTEIANYENNLVCLTAKSKKGSIVIKDLERRVENLKKELALLAEKIAEARQQ